MKVLGNPSAMNSVMRDKIESIVIDRGSESMRHRLVTSCNINGTIDLLDCGMSLREQRANLGANVNYVTLDILEDIKPNYLVDICDTKSMSMVRKKFDKISCFSILEHCYNPITASENLFRLLKDGGKIYGYVPFLFPRHSPQDLSYQDYFRFTRDSFAILFPRAKEIIVRPDRGRLGTSLMVLTLRYKHSLEKRIPLLANKINKIMSNGNNGFQTSGYEFLITK